MGWTLSLLEIGQEYVKLYIFEHTGDGLLLLRIVHTSTTGIPTFAFSINLTFDRLTKKLSHPNA